MYTTISSDLRAIFEQKSYVDISIGKEDVRGVVAL